MKKEKLIAELYYIIITIVLFLASFYLELHDIIVIYMLTRLCFKGWFDKNE